MDPSILLRLNSPTRELKGVTPDMQGFLLRYSLTGDVEDDDGNVNTRFKHPKLDELETYSVVVATCVSGGTVAGLGLPRGYFDWIFVDEAAHAAEPQGKYGAHIKSGLVR